jgi:hypothetical protein
MPATNGNGTGRLSAPVRNRFFYGKLMDVRHFEMEQRYFIETRRLLNRLGLGAGILCGLEATAAGEGRLLVRPGAAVDGRGREILVPEPYCLEAPLQPTDACGRPDGDPAAPGEPVTICLAYHECDAEPTPVLVTDCDAREGCRPGAVRERFRIVVRRGRPQPLGLSAEACAAIFPEAPPEGFDRRAAVCETLPDPCPAGDDACVPLAVVTAPADGGPLLVEACPVRPRLLSNAELLDLIMCLAARVDRCCAPHAEPPVLRALWPPNAVILGTEDAPEAPAAWRASWLEAPRLELTFDREMDAGRLGAPEPWLRLWAIVQRIPMTHVPPPTVVRLPLEAGTPVATTVLGTAGVTVAFRLRQTGGLAELRRLLEGGDRGRLAIAFLLQARADDPATQIIDAGTPAQLLDADFAGTGLEAAMLDRIWDLPLDPDGDGEPDHHVMDAGLMAGLAGAGAALPSGGDGEGGRLHATFAIAVAAQAPPVVLAHWPPNGARLERAGNPEAPAEWWLSWRRERRLEITFDRPMDEGRLDDPDGWLRAWRISRLDDGVIVVERLKAARLPDPDPPILGDVGPTVAYGLPSLPRVGPESRHLVQIRSEGGLIADADGRELDADFAGTALETPALNTIWDVLDRRDDLPPGIWDRLVTSGAALPQSGGDGGGGRLHLTFEIEEG